VRTKRTRAQEVLKRPLSFATHWYKSSIGVLIDIESVQTVGRMEHPNFEMAQQVAHGTTDFEDGADAPAGINPRERR
jgi:hypothetical protein